MIVVVVKPFVGTVGGIAYNMPAPGTRLDVSDEAGRQLLGMGVAQRMETKIDPLPEVKKNGGLSGLSHLVPVHRLKMRPS